MRVRLELTGYLSWYAPGRARAVSVEVPPGTTILAAVRLAHLPFGEVAFAVVDGEQRPLDTPVADGQRITLIPPIAGGDHPPGSPSPSSSRLVA